jgi:hypothetical protein
MAAHRAAVKDSAQSDAHAEASSPDAKQAQATDSAWDHLVNQSPRQVTQRHALHAAFGTATQRVIRTRDGHLYGRGDEKLPFGYRSNKLLLPLYKSGMTWLASSEADVKDKGDGGNAPMLSPHRHLIGEDHEQSHFEQALADWSWGADRMAEGFQSSAEVSDTITTSNQDHRWMLLWHGAYHGTKVLENLHAYTLGGLGIVRSRLGAQSAAENILSADAYSVYGATLGMGNLAATRNAFYNHQTIVNGLRKASLEAYKGHLRLMLQNYRRTCVPLEGTPRPPGNGGASKLHDLATAMTGLWDALENTPAALATRPYWRSSSWQNTSNYLAQRAAAVAAYITSPLDVFGDGLNQLNLAAARQLNGDGRDDAKIQANWNSTKGGGDALAELSKTRELFMAANINGLDFPGIVRIGQQHVTNLTGKITRGRYHLSYADFQTDTMHRLQP